MAILVWVVVVLPLTALVALWTDRTLEFWLSYFSHHAVEVPYWLSLLVTILLNGVIFAVNVLTEVCRLVL